VQAWEDDVTKIGDATKCPRCDKVHANLRPAFRCLHAWQSSVEKPRPDCQERSFTMSEYMILQGIVRRLGG